MTKPLIIVESPTKIKTLKKYVGKEFNIGASAGHIRDLPVKTLGIDIEKKFKTYVEFYVVGKLGRKIDFSSGESTILQNEIDKYWLRIKTSDSFMNYG